MRTIATARYKLALRRIKAAQKKQRYTQRDMAQRLGIPLTRYWGMVNGQTRIDMIEIADIAQVLGLPFEHFVPPRE